MLLSNHNLKRNFVKNRKDRKFVFSSYKLFTNLCNICECIILVHVVKENQVITLYRLELIVLEDIKKLALYVNCRVDKIRGLPPFKFKKRSFLTYLPSKLS